MFSKQGQGKNRQMFVINKYGYILKLLAVYTLGRIIYYNETREESSVNSLIIKELHFLRKKEDVCDSEL